MSETPDRWLTPKNVALIATTIIAGITALFGAEPLARLLSGDDHSNRITTLEQRVDATEEATASNDLLKDDLRDAKKLLDELINQLARLDDEASVEREKLRTRILETEKEIAFLKGQLSQTGRGGGR